MSDDVIYANTPALFTLKGLIAIHYLDGNVLEGHFATQDAFNIFLTVDGKPVMIPRTQIRFIKGEQGQPIEKDTSQKDLAETTPPPVDTLDFSQLESEKTYSLASDDDDDDDGTVVLQLGLEQDLLAAAEEEDDDDDDGTMVLYQEEEDSFDDDDGDDDDDDGTLIIEAPDSDVEDEDELDVTVLLPDSDEIPDWEEDDDTEDQTVVIKGSEEQEISANLLCVSGPHSGEVFKLTSGITTMGRSSDNVVILSNDKEISRHHAIVLQESGKFVVQDQNSLNGTFVNDEQVTAPHFLKDGDIILVGLSTLRYQAD